MSITPLTNEFAVSPQVLPDELEKLKAAGFRSIICNRPDGEQSGQPRFREIEAAATAIGLEVRHLPIVPGRMTQADVNAFARHMLELPKPILAFCRSGARSQALWTAAEAASHRR